MIRTAILMATCVLVVSGIALAGQDKSVRLTSDTAILETTLSLLNLEHPEQDMMRNVAHGDYRFMGINGYTCTAPDNKGGYIDHQLIEKYHIWCLEGTSDVIESDKHMKLIDKARAYAMQYNNALKKWLGERKVP